MAELTDAEIGAGLRAGEAKRAHEPRAAGAGGGRPRKSVQR